MSCFVFLMFFHVSKEYSGRSSNSIARVSYARFDYHSLYKCIYQGASRPMAAYAVTY